jgi:hypothetical protein
MAPCHRSSRPTFRYPEPVRVRAKGATLCSVEGIDWNQHDIDEARETYVHIVDGGVNYRARVPDGSDPHEFFRRLPLLFAEEIGSSSWRADSYVIATLYVDGQKVDSQFFMAEGF